jgi:TPR repeat protein
MGKETPRPHNGSGNGRSPSVRREPVKRGITGQLVRAAEGGNAGSQFNLGVLYDNSLDDNGNAIASNRAAAIKWLLLAARQNLPRAQIRLAEVYSQGAAVPANFVRACSWYLRATVNSSGMHRQKAQSGFDRAAANLSPGQIAEARRLADERERPGGEIATAPSPEREPEKMQPPEDAQ